MILQDGNGLNPQQRGILLAVTYADVFDYPLTINEIHRYCGIKASFNGAHFLLGLTGEKLNQLHRFLGVFGVLGNG